LKIIDDAIQMHGGAGVSNDFPLAEMFATIRTLRIADGPDEVHRALISKLELKKYKPQNSATPELRHCSGSQAFGARDRLTKRSD
jgi:Acyl-CoA dehydrogenase, C-terminal domain